MVATTKTGKPRREPRKGCPRVDGIPVHAHEIEPGRAVPNNWDKHLFEPWAERKARLAQLRRNTP